MQKSCKIFAYIEKKVVILQCQTKLFVVRYGFLTIDYMFAISIDVEATQMQMEHVSSVLGNNGFYPAIGYEKICICGAS